MIYLDTHVVVWLSAGLENRFSQRVKDLINKQDIYISPIVRLELQYLYETQRVAEEADVLIADLSQRLGLQFCNKGFNSVINQAMSLSWTRDPFDRLIVANASLDGNILITKDRNMTRNYSHATW